MDLEDSGGGMGMETVYGTHEDSHVVMSEKVQSLAGSIYQEFERMIARYDEDVVKTLMPLLVNVLECLDAAYQANQEHDVELELLREDNEQLVTQYEREKGGRKAAEQKLLEAEDIAECERKELAARLEALESIVRMLELKHKNSTEHASRLEEREAELKREYAKLHDRYTELFKTHMDYMERTKLLLSGGQLAGERAEIGRVHANRLNIGRSSGPVSFGFASLEGGTDGVDSIPTSPISSDHSSPSLHSELDGMNTSAGGGGGVKMVEKSQETDAVSLEHRGTVTSPSTPGAQPPIAPHAPTGRSQTKTEKRSANTLYQELSFQDSEALADVDEGADITGSWVHPGEYASSVNDNFFGMGKEVENLIMENNELLATKNALNIVKDDLIVKVDELTGEQEMLREEIGALKAQRERTRVRIAELEEEIRKLREATAAAEARNDQADDEQDVPMAQRKRFTRVEMARVLMERNQYKERFMELQEAVRWTEMIRASKNNPPLDKKSKQSVWKFFSNLFGGSERPSQPILAPHLSYHAPTHHVAPGVRALPRPGQEYLDTEIGSGSERLVARRAVERKEQLRQVRAHVRKDDGRLQAYGWSLPGKVGTGTPKGPGSTSTGVSVSGGAVPVPVPVYCRPLAETQPGMKIWCAAGVNLLGGHTRDGGLMVGGSVFYYDEPTPVVSEPAGGSIEVDTLDRELLAGREAAALETQLSSFVWICTSTRSASTVTVVDANNPAEILRTFPVCSNHLLCIASVPGATPDDYVDTVTNIIVPPEQPDQNDADADPDSLIGRISFVEVDISAEPQEKETPSECKEAEAEVEAEEAKADDSNSTEVKDENENMNGETSNPENSEGSEALPENNGESRPSAETENKDSVEDDDDTKQDSSNSEEKSERWERKEKMSSVLATMWLGAQSGWLYVHSSVANWSTCLHKVKLTDAVLAVVHVNGRVVAALADGCVAIFRRGFDGQWDLGRYHLVKLGAPQHSVRCLSVVGEKVWCGYRNRVHVLEPRTLRIVHTLEAHPRRESQVRQLAWLGEGVWVSIRLDSTLRLYHAHTYQHLQDVDIEPYVSKMLGTGKLGFSFVRITALLISSNRLWIGTGNGVIISVPLSECGGGSLVGGIASAAIVPRGTVLPGTGVRVPPPTGAPPGGFVPYCTMAHAQLSFHGHRDAVKFFVAVPGSGGMSAASTPSSVASDNHHQGAMVPIGMISPPQKKPPAMLVLSGGEGYIDFRIGDGDMEESVIETEPSGEGGVDLGEGHAAEVKGDKSHLIVWQVALV